VETRVEGIDDVKRMLADLQQTLPVAARSAKNDVIQVVWEGEKAQAVADLDRPKTFTISQILFDKKEGPTSVGRVWLRDPFDQQGADERSYLGVNTLSGLRERRKASEIALQAFGVMPAGTVWVPADNVKLDSYGNISSTAIQSMIAEFRQWRNVRNPARNFALIKDKGILTRIGGQWYPFIWFVDPRRYAERFDFYGRADKEVQYHWEAIYAKAIQRELDRWR
jgi:hypothetical protein